jgi:hypothetical protein
VFLLCTALKFLRKMPLPATLTIGFLTASALTAIPAKMLVNTFDKQVSFKLENGRLTFNPMRVRRIPCGKFELCPIEAPLRKYVDAFSLELANTGAADLNLIQRVEGAVRNSFPEAAKSSLEALTDSIALGWTDEGNAICRAHKRKPSNVLPRPYFEDVEYCVRLIDSDQSWDIPPSARRALRMQGDASISITKNPGSPYRELEPNERGPYEDALIGIVDKTKNTMYQMLVSEGWQAFNQNGTIRVIGLK